jgi:hypothetical protein
MNGRMKPTLSLRAAPLLAPLAALQTRNKVNSQTAHGPPSSS